MNAAERLAEYLDHYAHKRLAPIAQMLADDVSLRDWNLSVRGKAAVLAETAKNFEAAGSIQIETLALYSRGDSAAAAELHIVVDGVALWVVDVLEFTADGRIQAIRAYLGRADD
jgi:SnoaL-like domain